MRASTERILKNLRPNRYRFPQPGLSIYKSIMYTGARYRPWRYRIEIDRAGFETSGNTITRLGALFVVHRITQSIRRLHNDSMLGMNQAKNSGEKL